MEYEEFTPAPAGSNILAEIAETAREVIRAREQVTECEEALKAAQARLRSLQEAVLPELMSIAQQDDLTTVDGYRITIKDMVRGQPSRETEDEAFKWLRSTGNGSLIKSVVTADLGRASQETIDTAEAALSAVGLRSSRKSSVNWQSLGALVRERISQGLDVPMEILGVHMWKQADVKPR